MSAKKKKITPNLRRYYLTGCQVLMQQQTNSRAMMNGILCRSAALFIFLYQFRLLAADLSDTPIFITTLLGAFLCAFILDSVVKKRIAAPFVILLIPVVVRFLIMFPRLLFDDANIKGIIQIDSLLLNYDRNSFVTIIPFYWIAFSSFFSAASRRFLRFSVIADCFLLVASFGVVHSLTLYRWPVLRIIVFTLILFLELCALILSAPPTLRPQKKDAAFSILFLLLLVSVCGALLVRPLQKQALEQGGGLLQPNLFSFDFAPYLTLENEISMNDDLIFIVRKGQPDSADDDTPSIIDEIDGVGDSSFFPLYAGDDHYLMRRFVLSAYNTEEGADKNTGFYRNGTIDEKTQSAQLPPGKTFYQSPETEKRRKLKQEYYIINIDSSAFIAMNEVEEVLPYESWDTSSFKSAYAVQSNVSVSLPIDLINAVGGAYDAALLGMSEADYDYYTTFHSSPKITALAEEISGASNNYWEKIQLIYEYLKFGEYRYSLKPGIAPDGDQLLYFLFDVKKGYCSYFAFAFASLLRSIGVPSRVAVGFFLNPEEAKLDFYPIRSNMAHAWVEVWYPEYGWIEYDPTTQRLAEGEDFEFSTGIPPELFERLMKEIIDNHDRLKAKEAPPPEESAAAQAARDAVQFIKHYFVYALVAAALIVFLGIRFGYRLCYLVSKNPRNKTALLWRRLKQRIYFSGGRKLRTESEGEWIARYAGLMPDENGILLQSLYQNVSAARYAKEYTPDDHKEFKVLYDKVSRLYKTIFSILRKNKTWPPLIIILAFCISVPSGTSFGQEYSYQGDTLYQDALQAEAHEYWERAIELYSQGKNEYPYDARFPLGLGNLYFYRELYLLAMDEYLTAEKLLPDNTQLLYQIAQTAGNLNENKMAAGYLENVLALEPDNRDAIGSLGWMYFKLHRLRDGEALLLNALKNFGAEPDFCMTLATIYSDMFNYPDAKRYYLDAINASLRMGSREFSAVAYYNLSILDSRFYRYQDALNSTAASLALSDRASGHLARGELMLRRLDFDSTFKEYQRSYEVDKSQLSKLSLAQAFLIAGRLEEARLYAEDSLKSNNLYWMMNYGINPDQYRRDLHEIIYKVYAGLEKTARLTARVTTADIFEGIKTRLVSLFKSKVHKLLFQKYSLISAVAFEANKSTDERHLDALVEYYNAFGDYKNRALYYLQTARDFELELIPESEPAYLFEQGKLLRDETLLNDALSGFDPVWEKDMIADTYTELALYAKAARQDEIARNAAGRLYALNAGALRQNALRLPVNLELTGGAFAGGSEAKKIGKMLGRAGFEVTNGRSVSRWTLRLRSEDAAITAELFDGGTGITKVRKTIPLSSSSNKAIAEFANTLAREVFN
jgi:transglutaminase-like putative cysteine protease